MNRQHYQVAVSMIALTGFLPVSSGSHVLNEKRREQQEARAWTLPQSREARPLAPQAVGIRSRANWERPPQATEPVMGIPPGNGIVNTQSRHAFDETIAKLTSLLQARGITLFALLDHSGEAAKVGMRMRPTKLFIFGNPRAGTPLMVASPSIALDLPLKILVSEDGDGKVWLSYNAAAFLEERHHLPHDLARPLEAVTALVSTASE